MAKWGKRLLGLAAISGVVAGLVYYLKNNSSCELEDEFCDDCEGDDCDLDNDLKPVTDREYVPLNPAPQVEDAADANTQDSETVLPE